MPDELLPTPTAETGGDGQRKDGFRRLLEPEIRRTSASSQESEGSTSPPKPTDTAASDRSNGTPTAPASSNDGGRLFPVGKMSPRSRLLSSPSVINYEDDPETWHDRNRRLVAEGKAHAATGAAPLGVQVRGLTSSSEASPASPPPPPADGREPQMIAGYGLSSPVSLASYDPETSSWRTFQASLLSTEDERFPRSWERWPTSGMTRRGRAFALPTSAHLTDGNASSYLPTPTTQDGANTGGPSQYDRNSLPLNALLHTPTTGDTTPNYDHRASPGYTRDKPVPNLAAQIEDELLPTPRGTDANGKGAHGDGGPDLRTSVGDLTTPRSDDGNEP